MADDLLSRLSSALEGRYRIERELGQGGMATVYLADDLKHDRKVAIKVLKPELAAVIGAERFVTEIKTTAALQHPHILPLFDSGEAGSFLYYVMPYVEGESLRGRLDRQRQLGVAEAVELASAVASALQYAHERGIVHRDIKPENILIHANQPVVADFGIALALSAAGGGRLTETGLSLGTPHYMSPEQATAEREVTARSDLYSLACVVYEMLTGDPPHTGPTAQAVLIRILTEDPRPVSDLRRTVPRHVQGALAKALEKLPADRFESADAFARALEDESYEYVSARRGRVPRPRASPEAGSRAALSTWISDRRSVALFGVAGILAAGWILGGLGQGDAPEPSAAARVLPAFHYEVTEMEGGDTGLDLSPSGAVVWPGGGPEEPLRIRFPGDRQERRLAGTEGAFHPAFSPDGEWIVFTTGGELRKVPTEGGPVVSLARTETPPMIFPHWGPDGVIAFAQADGLYRVPDVGGAVEKVLGLEGQYAARVPFVLPDGAGWLFTRVTGGLGSGDADLMLLDPRSGDTTVVADGGSGGAWLPSGHVAFTHRSGSLFAAPFDLRRGRFRSPPAPVLDSVRPALLGRTFAASSTGSAAYVSGAAGLGAGPGLSIVFMNVAEGEDRVPPLDRADHQDGRFSPDGRKLAYTHESHIWIYDLELGSRPRFTAEDYLDVHDPVWSPDGRRIAFGAAKDDPGSDVWVRDADGDSAARLVFQREAAQFPREWTDEGLVVQTSHAGNADLWIVPVDGEGEPRPYLRADWNEQLARVSPDGRWLAYESWEDELPVVLVRAFPEPGRAYRVSTGGAPAIQPVWSRDGNVLYYRRGITVMAAEVRTEPDFEVVSHREIRDLTGDLRDAHPDGEHLLAFRFGEASSSETPARLVVVANWLSELLERLGERGAR